MDANGGHSTGQAVRVATWLADHDVTWFEEPVSSQDLAGFDGTSTRTAVPCGPTTTGQDMA